jgi:hypothetical protein
LTNLGIRLVDKDVLEAADAFGSSSWQRLKNVQMPLALPTIMAGINQTIMMALAMVVVASMVGVQGLGQQVLKAIKTSTSPWAYSTVSRSSVCHHLRPCQSGLWQAPSAPYGGGPWLSNHTGIGISYQESLQDFRDRDRKPTLMPSRAA